MPTEPQPPPATATPAAWTAYRQALALFHRPLAHWVLRRSFAALGPRRLGDLAGHAEFALVEATHRFDPARGTKFTTFAVRWIWGRLKSELAREAKHAGVRTFGVLEDLTGEENRFDPAAPAEPCGLEAADERARARRHLDVLMAAADLPARERVLLVRKYGRGETLAAIGPDLGLSRERVRQLAGRALRKVREAAGEAEPEAPKGRRRAKPGAV